MDSLKALTFTTVIFSALLSFTQIQNKNQQTKNSMTQNFYCKYCGTKAQSVASLTGNLCYRHPGGANKGKHALYQGSEKPQYTCMHCGTKASSITSLAGNLCYRHPNGANKGRHEPAL